MTIMIFGINHDDKTNNMKVIYLHYTKFPDSLKNSRNIDGFTVDKIYQVLDIFDPYGNDPVYELLNDRGETNWILGCRFKPLHQVRNEKLNQIGI